MKEIIGFIGVGEFAQHLIHGFKRLDADVDIVLSPRNRQRTTALSRKFDLHIAASNAEVVDAATVIFLCTRPKQMQEALANLPWAEKHLLISVAAGVSLERLRSLVAPADVCLSMLVNAAAAGCSPVSLFPDNTRATNVLQHLGHVYDMPDETAFEAASVFGAVYGWIFALADNLERWSNTSGIPDAAARGLAVSTLQAAMTMANRRNNESLKDLTDELRTPGGITQHGLEQLGKQDALRAWQDACASVLTRLSKPY